MSQPCVERIIGVLATDEALRRNFAEDPQATLQRLLERGYELTGGERAALATLDPGQLSRFADAIDPRLQRADLRCGR